MNHCHKHKRHSNHGHKKHDKQEKCSVNVNISKLSKIDIEEESKCHTKHKDSSISGNVVQISGQEVSVFTMPGEFVTISGTVATSVSGNVIQISGQTVNISGQIVFATFSGTIAISVSGNIIATSISGNIVQIS